MILFKKIHKNEVFFRQELLGTRELWSKITKFEIMLAITLNVRIIVPMVEIFLTTAPRVQGQEKMMRKGDLTRDQAISVCGIDAVDKLDKLNCDFTNRVQTDGDDAVEFSSAIKTTDKNGNDCTLIAYYYQDQDDLDETDDFGSLDWVINGYEIV